MRDGDEIHYQEDSSSDALCKKSILSGGAAGGSISRSLLMSLQSALSVESWRLAESARGGTVTPDRFFTPGGRPSCISRLWFDRSASYTTSQSVSRSPHIIPQDESIPLTKPISLASFAIALHRMTEGQD